MPDEGHKSPGRPPPNKACRLEQDSVRITLRSAGNSDPLGWVQGVYEGRAVECITPVGVLRYHHVTFPVLVVQHVQAILLAQGMLLQDLFPPDAYFLSPHSSVLARGPFVLLAATYVPPVSPPPRLENVVLAAPEIVPEGLTRDDVLALLLKAEW